VACVIQAPALAQPPSGVNLIMNKSVQEELNLTADQMKDLWAGVHKVREKYKDEFAKHKTREQAEGAGLFAKVDKEVLKAAILKPEQAKRLKQIEFQQFLEWNVPRAFRDADNAKELRLTDRQKKWVVSVLLQYQQDVTAAAFAQDREAIPKLNKKALDDIRSSLNDEQKKKLEEMTGKPFVIVGDVHFHPIHVGAYAEHITAKKRVQDELKLTKAQVKSLEEGLRKVGEEILEQFANVPVVRPGTDPKPGAAPAMPDPKMVAELVHKRDAGYKKVLAEVLKPEQASRLKQIELQLEGLRALQNKEVALALKLTDDQKRQVKKLFEDIANSVAAAAGRVPSGADQETMRKFREEQDKAFTEAWNKAFKEATEKIPSLLTPEQRRRWEAMTGAPFRLEPVDAPKRGPADNPKARKER
jgi:hypothetical protein